MTSFSKVETPYYHMDTAMYPETHDSLAALSEMGLSSVTNAVDGIIQVRRMYAEAVNNGHLWIVNTGTKILPLVPKDPASCPLEGPLTSMRMAITEGSYAYMEPLSRSDERDDLAGFWWSAHMFYNDIEMHSAAEHSMHVLFPGKRLFKQMGELTLSGILA